MANKETIPISFKITEVNEGLKKLLSDADSLRGIMAETAKAATEMGVQLAAAANAGAEPLRALISMQGELADTFSTNVSDMANSAEAMKTLFADMNSTGELLAQTLRDNTSALRDMQSSSIETTGTYAALVANILSTIVNLRVLYDMFKGVTAIQWLAAQSSQVLGQMTSAVSTKVQGTITSLEALRATAGTSAMACQVLKIALRGLLISSGIGIAIWGLTEIISYFANASDKAAASTDNLQAQQEKAKRAAEEEERMRQQENQTLTDTRAQLELHIATLKNFNGTKEQEDKLIARMNNTYGDTMGYFSSLAEWYNALTKNSKAYCDQMIIEARIRKLTNEIAEIQNKKDALLFDEFGNEKKYNKNRGFYIGTTEGMSEKEIQTRRDTGHVIVDGKIYAPSEDDIKNQKLANLDRQEKGKRKQVDKMMSTPIEMPVMGSTNPPKTTTTTTSSNKGGTDNDKDKLSALEEIEAQIRENQKAAVELAASEDESAKKDLEKLREETLNLVKRRDELRKVRDSMVTPDEENYTPPAIEDIKTYEELDKAIDHYSDELRKAEAGKRDEIIKTLKEHKKLREEWEKADNPTPDTGPKFNAGAKSIKEIEENIAYLQKELEKAEDIDTAAGLNRQIKEWQELGETMRNAGMESRDTFGTLREGWEDMKGIGSGVESITSAIEGNGNAWQMLTGIIDGFLQIYDGIKGVVGVIDALSQSTKGHAVAEGVDAGAKIANTIATGAETQAIQENTNASMQNIGAKSGEAIANAAESGSKMPFPMNIIAIAAGVAAVIAAIATIGSFASGGIVGGASKTGDRLLARVNSGEMILNASQQQNLFRVINTSAATLAQPRKSFEITANTNLIEHFAKDNVNEGHVTFRIDGRTLVGVLANETRTSSRSGKKTNIKL